MKIIKRILSNKIIKWIIIPLLLVLFWLIFSLIYSSYKSLTVLQYSHNQDASNKFFERRLLKNEKLNGEFTAKDNNLGIVSVRFGYIPRVDFSNEDILIFKIKEKGSNKWLYENNYRSGSFDSNQFYPFGFPLINNSKGKIYKFEILSQNGNKDNAMETTHTNPIYLTKYKYSTAEVFKNLSSIIKFMKEKIITFVSNSDSLLASIVFMLPFMFYMTWILLFHKKMKDNKEKISGKVLLVALIFLLIIFEVIFYEFLIPGLLLGLLGLWILFNYINKYDGRFTFILAFILLLLSVFSIYFNFKISVDKATTYAYMLIIIGFFQELFIKNVKK